MASSSAASSDGTFLITEAGSLRLWGILILVSFVVTSVVGGSLTSESSYLPLMLGAHIGLALLTLGLSSYATSIIGRRYKSLPRVGAALSAAAALGATIGGTVFLLGGQSNGPLYAMEGFAVVGIAAALVMIVLGGPAGRYVVGASRT